MLDNKNSPILLY